LSVNMLSPIVVQINGGDGEVTPIAPYLRDSPPTPNNTARALRIANVVAFIAVLVSNALGATGKLPGSKPVSDVSNNHHTELTPAGFTFGIWSVIYTLQIFFVFYQSSKTRVRLVRNIGPFYVLQCLANAGWVVAFTQDTRRMINVSQLCIFSLLIFLMTTYMRAGCWRTDRSGFTFLSVDVALSLYTAWVLCATVVGISIVMQVNGIQGLFGLDIDQIQLVLLGLALLIATTISFVRRDFVFPLVFSWASFGINRNGGYPRATAATIVLGVAVGLAVMVLRATAPRDRRSRAPLDGYWR